MEFVQNSEPENGLSLTSSILSGLWTTEYVVQDASLNEEPVYPHESLSSIADLHCDEENDLFSGSDCEFVDDVILSDCSLNEGGDSWLEWFKGEVGPIVGDDPFETVGLHQDESKLQESSLSLSFMDLKSGEYISSDHSLALDDKCIALPTFNDLDLIQPQGNVGDPTSPDSTHMNLYEGSGNDSCIAIPTFNNLDIVQHQGNLGDPSSPDSTHMNLYESSVNDSCIAIPTFKNLDIVRTEGNVGDPSSPDSTHMNLYEGIGNDSCIAIPTFNNLDIVQHQGNLGDPSSPDSTYINDVSPIEQGSINYAASFANVEAVNKILADLTCNGIDFVISTPNIDSEVLLPHTTIGISEKENRKKSRRKIGETRENKQKIRKNTDAELKVRRIKNQVSASKYRSKKKELNTEIFEKCAMMEVKNKKLKSEVNELQKAVDYMKDLLVEIVRRAR